MNVLAISAHPDDETLGCGGTLLHHVAEGDHLRWLVVTEAHPPQWSTEVIARKAEEVAQVADAYGIESVMKLAMPTTQLDTVPISTLIDGIRSAIEKSRPQTVYLPHSGDVHTDHAAVFLAAMSVLKSFYMKQLDVQRVIVYETLSSTEAAPPLTHRAFVPTLYRDISPYLEQKLRIMAMYVSEAQPDPLPRGPSAIRALARYRGATVAVEYAEAFELIREVV